MEHRNPDKMQLHALLSERNQYPERAVDIDRRIVQLFERKVAVLALDMCGFSRLTSRYGIIHFLAMIQQMKDAAFPAVAGNNGTVIKCDADNLFAIFPTPAQALEGALDIFRAFEAMNAVLPDRRDLYGSIGIGYGSTLVIDDEDLFGNEVNIACKLGEDLAQKMEILVTPAAYEALPEAEYVFSSRTFVISGMELECRRFEKRASEEN